MARRLQDGDGDHFAMMIHMHSRKFLLILLTIATIAIAAATVEAQQDCTSAQCHVSLTKGASVHAAADDCTSCHESVETPHPQKGKQTFKLSQDQPDLCYMCHESVATKAQVHSPVKEGMCTACHNPHSSEQAKLLAQPASELCISCHGDKQDFPVVHGPTGAGDCLSCHVPHESELKSLLSQKEDALCASCHTDMSDALKKKIVHPPVIDGCATCHNPHGSAHKKLLPEAGIALCTMCHSEIGEAADKAAVVHAPIKTDKNCASCHSPHSSDHAKLLPQETKDLCLSCHTNVITQKMTVLHAPVEMGDCASCHTPHAGSKKLLTASYPATDYVAYTDKEFELCFTCHNRDLVQYPDTSFATGFRDGEKNLHFVHVNKKEKGRSCKMCHNAHGGTNPMLVADSVPFGKWNLPIKFQKAENGGSCAPGCHKPYTYDRNKPTAATGK